MIERNVYYLQMNMQLPEALLLREGVLPVQPVSFYKRGFMDEIGVRYYYGNPKSTKALIVLSGGTLEAVRGRGMTDADVLDRYMSMGAKCSRIDLAVTDYIEDEFCTINDVKSWVYDGRVNSKWVGGEVTSLSKMTEDKSDRLETFYVGNMAQRGKKGIFRAYDKGIQSGLDAEIITRLEVEIRSDVAQSTAVRMATGQSLSGNFRACFDVAHSQFERLMDAPAIVPIRGKGQVKQEIDEKMTKRWDWLIEQVAPALKEAKEWDTKQGLKDDRLMKFLVKSGLMKDIREYAENLADRKYRDKLYINDIEPDETG